MKDKMNIYNPDYKKPVKEPVDLFLLLKKICLFPAFLCCCFMLLVLSPILALLVMGMEKSWNEFKNEMWGFVGSIALWYFEI